MKDSGKYNYQMCILSVIGICFVMLGHLSNTSTSPGTFYGWFPYYSFHMPLFLFISGYFFRDHGESPFFRSFGRFLLKKCRTLVLPFYLINSAFLGLSLILEHWGFVPEYHYGFLEWLISPFIYTQPVTFAIPTWYLMGLFFTEIWFLLIRKILSLILKNDLRREIILLILTLLIGVGSIWLRNTHAMPEAAVVYLRSGAMLFFLEAGLFYRKYLETYDRAGNMLYFAAVFFCQFLLLFCLRGKFYNPGLYNLVYFDHTGILYFLSGITGIALWLRISRILASIPYRSRCLVFIGQHTREIMSFHLFGYFLLNTVFYLLYSGGMALSWLGGFDPEQYHQRIYYSYLDNPRFLLLYFISGMLFSLLMAWIFEAVRKQYRRRSRRHI